MFDMACKSPDVNKLPQILRYGYCGGFMDMLYVDEHSTACSASTIVRFKRTAAEVKLATM